MPSLRSTGSPPLHANRCGLSACWNRGAVGVPSRIAKPPPLSRSVANVPPSPQCTQSRVPSVLRFTSDGTADRDTASAPGSGGRLVGAVGAGRDDFDGDGVALSIGMIGPCEGMMTRPSGGAAGSGSGVLRSERMARVATKPKPITTSTPARMTEPAVGA